MFVSYGWFAVATYLGVYVTTLSGLFACVHFGLIGVPVDVGAYLDASSMKKALLGDAPLQLPPVASEFLFAWLLTKTTEPARLVVTIAAVPWLVRHAPAPLLRLLRVPPDMWTPRFPALRRPGAVGPAVPRSPSSPAAAGTGPGGPTQQSAHTPTQPKP